MFRKVSLEVLGAAELCVSVKASVVWVKTSPQVLELKV